MGGREDDGAQWEAHVLGDRRLEPRLLLGAPRERPELEGAQRSQRNAIAVAVVGRCEGGPEQLEQRAAEQLGVAHLLPVGLQSGGGDAEQLRAPRRRERWRAAAVAREQGPEGGGADEADEEREELGAVRRPRDGRVGGEAEEGEGGAEEAVDLALGRPRRQRAEDRLERAERRAEAAGDERAAEHAADRADDGAEQLEEGADDGERVLHHRAAAFGGAARSEARRRAEQRLDGGERRRRRRLRQLGLHGAVLLAEGVEDRRDGAAALDHFGGRQHEAWAQVREVVAVLVTRGHHGRRVGAERDEWPHHLREQRACVVAPPAEGVGVRSHLGGARRQQQRARRRRERRASPRAARGRVPLTGLVRVEAAVAPHGGGAGGGGRRVLAQRGEAGAVMDAARPAA